jgi:hypothetical protein
LPRRFARTERQVRSISVEREHDLERGLTRVNLRATRSVLRRRVIDPADRRDE